MKAQSKASELLKELGVSDIISVVDNLNSNDVNSVADARSAAFIAMGVSIKKRTHCALIVSGEYITNILTAVTEAWFQKANLLVVGLFDDVRDLRTTWMDRYLVNRLDVRLEEIDTQLDEIRDMISEQGPKLLSIICPPSDDIFNDYGSLINVLSEGVDSNQTITVFNAKPDKSITNKNKVMYIDKRYKYGVISKYIGASILSSSGVLLCNSECLIVDINVLRTKYKKPWMKIIIHDPEGLVIGKKIDKWIINNGWNYLHTENLSLDEVNEFMESKEPSIIVVR